MLVLNSNRLFDIAMDPDTVDFSSFQATAASSRTWSPRFHTPPRDLDEKLMEKSKLTLRDKDWFGMSVKYLLVSHLGHRDHLKQLHHQLSLYKLFVSSVFLKKFDELSQTLRNPKKIKIFKNDFVGVVENQK